MNIAVNQPVKQDEVLSVLNQYYLMPRKSHQITDHTGKPVELKPEIMKPAYDSLKQLGVDVPAFDPVYGWSKVTCLDEITAWSIFWQIQAAVARSAIAFQNIDMRAFLPGRSMNYESLIYDHICPLFNGGSESIDGKKILEMGEAAED